ncbi:MAG: NAD(+) synthase [Thermodesulfobacteriota bacterium]|nr:NAD(+) synthase [Thermodesulfobacteriota bacterium]
MKVSYIIDHIVKWLREYVEKSGLKGFIVGVSGGVDSAVTSALCAGTGKKVILLNMPIHQLQYQTDLAAEHIKWLEKEHSNVAGREIDLTSSFQGIKKSLPHEIQDDLTMANTRSRLRMLTLYAFASHNRMLVAGTGNKVEDFGVGFYTKYGDGGVDLSPIADLMKSEVYLLAEELGIIQAILNAPPTDGLFEDSRTDEGQLGASYAELESAMEFDIKISGSDLRDESELDRRQKEVLAIFRKLNRANRHKMEPVPVCRIPGEFKNLI